MKIIFWITAALYAVAMLGAYYNRDSEKVITTASLGAVALIGSLVALSVFNSERAIRKVFSVPIIIQELWTSD